MWYGEAPMVARMGQDAWPVQQNSAARAAVYGGGAAVKRECAGTGVFLPRRYNNACKRPGIIYAIDFLELFAFLNLFFEIEAIVIQWDLNV